jgi:hypothetical protein
MTQFYTYLWLREDGTPYYVGKGQGRRAIRSKDHNVHHPGTTARVLVEHWGSEEEAFEMEVWYISLFGRKDIGTGCLRNRTNGGEGISGYRHTEAAKEKLRLNAHPPSRKGVKHTEETRKQMGESRIGKVSFWKDKTLSEDTKRKMSEAQSRRWAKVKGATA